MFSALKSHSIRFLLVGYLLLIALTAGILLIDSSLLEDQFVVIDSSDKSTKKMQVIVDLIEIARSRVRLSHELLSTEDVFDKDEISQEISESAERFLLKHEQLMQLELNETERDLIKAQLQDYPKVIQKLREIRSLAFEASIESNTKARNIIIFEIVPVQEIIIDRFMTMLQRIQVGVSHSRDAAISSYSNNEVYRYVLILSSFIASFGVLLWVIKRMSLIESKLHSFSLTDALTDIPNRRSFDEKIISEWKRSNRENSPLSLLLIDIDYFKNYNDFYGHQEGDRCLVKAASIIKSSARRENDLAARYGGEEFAVILPNTDSKSAQQIASQLIHKLKEQKIPHEKSEISDYLTFSIGIATNRTPNGNDSWEYLIELADKALYLSKDKGRNQFNLVNN